MKKFARDQSIYIFLLFVILVLIVGTFFFPTNENLPNRDSGVFLYVGQQILDGSIPYRDIWDHKGPVIYYVNALGLFIGQGSQWGVLLVELFSLFIAVSLGYIVMSKSFGRIPAVFASITWLLAIVYLIYDDGIREKSGGNLTEEYSLPLSFATLYFFWRSRNSSSNLFYIFLIGSIFSISFLLRPNNTGMQISAALFIFFAGVLSHRKYDLIKQILAFILGSTVILIPVLFYFEWNNALNDFFDLFLRYNLIHSTSSLRDKIVSIYYGLLLLSPSGLPLIALVTWIVGIFSIGGGLKLQKSQRDLICLGLIGMPVEFILAALSGRQYNHYYICWLPIFAILTSFFIFSIITQFSSIKINIFKRAVSLNYLWTFAFLIAMSGLTCVKIYSNFEDLILSNKQKLNPGIEKIRKYTKDENYLLMWGAESSVNYVTEIKAPTRYVYQYPLYTCGYYTEEMINEFLDDIAQKKPLIVDTSMTNELIPPIDDNERKQWINAGGNTRDCLLSPKMDDVFKFINSRYEPVDVISKNGWTLYKYRDNK
ncbi:MAG: glycosyltransferase family 39 protein [Deltaproteobacteria bacterium]